MTARGSIARIIAIVGSLMAILLVVAPFVVTLVLSLLDYSPVLPDKSGSYVGLMNYVRAFNDTEFIASIVRSLKFAICSVSIELILGFGLAYWLYVNRVIARWLLPILLLPCFVPPITTALTWRLLGQSQFGVIPYLLEQTTGNSEIVILGDAGLAFWYLVFVDVWQWLPLVSLILFVGFNSVPQSTVESARVDGATEPRIFKDIITSQILPFVVVATIVRVLDSLRLFESIHVLTGGGPGSATEMLNYYIWKQNFRFWDMGYGAALSVLSYMLTLIACVVMFSKLRRVLRWV